MGIGAEPDAGLLFSVAHVQHNFPESFGNHPDVNLSQITKLISNFPIFNFCFSLLIIPGSRKSRVF
jgi:hypothetical protein